MRKRILLKNEKFNKLTVKQVLEPNEKGVIKVLCLCECGNEKIVTKSNLLSNHTKSCGCIALDYIKNQFHDLSNQKFDRLFVLKKDLSKKSPHWICICDCGNTKSISSKSLKSGHTKSCGCLHKEKISKINYIHGNSKSDNESSEYKSWCQMKYRCYNDNFINYHRYGGRGIKVCDRWLNSFENFLQDMGKKPSKKHTLDRIDSDLDYSPENCRWATQLIQQGNRTNNVWIEFNGKNMILSDWGRFLKVKPEAIRYKLKKGISFFEIYNEFSKKNVP